MLRFSHSPRLRLLWCALSEVRQVWRNGTQVECGFSTFLEQMIPLDHQGFGNQDPALREDNDELESRMARWPRPSIVEIEGTFLEDLDTAYFNDVLPGEDQGTGNPGVDAYLYVGPRDSLLRSPRSAQAMTDDAYIAELQDRADRVGAGPDSPRHPDTIFRAEAEAGPFLFDPDRAPVGNGQGVVTEGGEGPPGEPGGEGEGEGSTTAGLNGSGG
jgi:hypothetical protein